MYLPREVGDRLAFGDIVQASWLYDIYLRPDSRALYPKTFSGNQQGFVIRPEPGRGEEDDKVFAQATMDPDDVVFGYGSLRAAIVLTDDCEMASLAGERGEHAWTPRGRLLFASIRAATEEKIERQLRRPQELGLHPLPADEASGFPGGLVDFTRVFSVQAIAMLERKDDYRRLVGLDRDGQIQLAMRWAGHGTRHGPLAAQIGSAKLSQLLTADGDAERLAALRAARAIGDEASAAAATATLAALTEAWWVEGPLFDDIDAAVETAEPAGPIRDRLVQSLTVIRASADAALGHLGESTWSGDGGSVDA